MEISRGVWIGAIVFVVALIAYMIWRQKQKKPTSRSAPSAAWPVNKGDGPNDP